MLDDPPRFIAGEHSRSTHFSALWLSSSAQPRLSISPQSVAHHGGLNSPIRSLFPFPTPRVGVPNALREQAIQIGKRRIVIDEEPEALAICFARPLAVPDLTTRIMRVEVLASEC